MRPTLLCTTLLACATACPADPEATTTDASTSGTSSDSSSNGTDTTDPTTEATTADEPTTGDATTTETSTGAPAGFCGDGELDDGERCDDGNDALADGCEACQPVAHVDWTVTVSGDDGANDRASDVAIAADGTIIVVGYQDGTANTRRPLIVRLAPDGTMISKYVHPNEYDYGYYESIAIAADGSYYVAGANTIDPGDATSAALHKFSSDHTFVWAQEQPAPTVSNASARGVAVSADAVYTAGVENGVPARMFVRRHSPDTGAIEWDWDGPDPTAAARAHAVAVAGDRVFVVGTWDLAGEHYPVAAVLDPQGDKIAHASLNSPGEFTDVEAYGDDIVISGWQVPLDHTPLLWRTDRELGGVWLTLPENDGEFHGVATDPVRGVAVAGLVGLADYDADVHVGLHDDTGMQLWTTVDTGVMSDGDDRGEDVAFGPHSFVAVGGVGGPDGTYDLWIRRILFG